MTNYEKIKHMSIEEMALYLSTGLPICPLQSFHCMDNNCLNCFKKWLGQEVDE